MAPFNFSGVPTVAQMSKCRAESSGRQHFKCVNEYINKLDHFKNLNGSSFQLKWGANIRPNDKIP